MSSELRSRIAPSRIPSIAILLGASIGLALASCERSEGPRLVSAEFLDESANGVAVPEETIRLSFDRPMATGYSLETMRISTEPPLAWSKEIQRTPDPRVFLVRVLTGSPALVPPPEQGRVRLLVDLGSGEIQSGPIQFHSLLPVLERAIWVDRPGPSGNLVVDGGDWIRLVFDRPVTLAIGPGEEPRVRCPQDIVLSKVLDRLDDGEVRSVFAPGDAEDEVKIILGSRPVLTISGTFGGSEASVPRGVAPLERFRPETPSGLALGGTRLLPLSRIRDRRGGTGSVSLEEVDIECGEGFPLPREYPLIAMPEPGNRSSATLTPIAGGRAVLAGGFTATGRMPLAQVLLFDPFQGGLEAGTPFSNARGALPHPTVHHTATVLAGPDGRLQTSDDRIVVAGGFDGSRSLEDISIIHLREDGAVEVEALPERLRVPRAEHAAVAVASNALLVDGGRTTGLGENSGILGCAELLVFEFAGGKTRIQSQAVFRTIPRMRHALCFLGPAENGTSYVLAHGGFGRPALKALDDLVFGEPIVAAPSRDVYLPSDEGVVLSSPVILDVARPTASFAKLSPAFEFALLRWGHAAVPIHEADAAADGSSPFGGHASCLLAGGTLRHPLHGFDGGPALWEMPMEALPNLPRGHEAAAAIRFTFNLRDPVESRFEVLAHPAPDPRQSIDRIHFAAVRIPSEGVFILGGEQPGEGRDPASLRTVVAYLEEDGRISDLALPLSSPRSRHGAYLVNRGGIRSIFLLGGIPGGEARESLPAVEELPLR